VAVDAAGNVYVADQYNNRVRIISRSTGIIATYAGTGAMGSVGDGMAATGAHCIPHRSWT
jgi:DNA-binding beta-propeller fold protein YncE